MSLLRTPNYESATASNLDFQRYFRCPPDFSPFEIDDPLPEKSGFFSFEQTICYGRSSGGSSPTCTKNLPEALTHSRGDKVVLPFSVTDLVNNLRLESYVRLGSWERFLSNIYYCFRSGMPKAMRQAIQRIVFQRRLQQFPSWPIDVSVDDLFSSLMKVALQASGARECPFIWFWPKGQSSAVMMTHDVEEQRGAELCEMLMDLDDSFGIVSAFQVVPEARYEKSEGLIRAIQSRGYEVNLHDLDHDGRLYADEKRFRERVRKINEYARKFRLQGFRAGSMHRNQGWFHLLDFKYDMSVPNAAHLEPQRGGCCTVMPFFVGDMLELPLTTLQDHAVFHLLSEAPLDLWKRQIELVNAHHGLISFIVHPDYLASERERDLYRQLLTHLIDIGKRRNMWFALPGRINEWWRQRSEMQLVQRGSTWIIDGKGSERATIAYAQLENERLVYRVDAIA